jgi:hypothetical protein
MKSTRIAHAPSTPLPELAEFLAPFRVHFTRSEGPAALERYLTGLLTEHPNKNCDTIAQVSPAPPSNPSRACYRTYPSPYLGLSGCSVTPWGPTPEPAAH